MLKDARADSGGQASASAGDAREPRRLLACAGCRRVITSIADRIEVNGSHQHIFVNPDNERFLIGCFANASGLRGIGASCLEATWFSGYAWQSEICADCRSFLGWLYRRGDHRFHGLVLDVLIEIDEG